MLTREARNEMLQIISDLSKEAYGYRVRFDYAAMSDDELQRTWDRFINAADAAMAHEKAEKERTQQAWEQHIATLIAMGAGDRATAICWDMQAEGTDGYDIGYYYYRKGIDYSNENTIKQLLAA